MVRRWVGSGVGAGRALNRWEGWTPRFLASSSPIIVAVIQAHGGQIQRIWLREHDELACCAPARRHHHHDARTLEKPAHAQRMPTATLRVRDGLAVPKRQMRLSISYHCN